MICRFILFLQLTRSHYTILTVGSSIENLRDLAVISTLLLSNSSQDSRNNKENHFEVFFENGKIFFSFFSLLFFSVLLMNRRTKPDDCRRPFVPFDRISQDSRVCERPVYVAVVKKIFFFPKFTTKKKGTQTRKNKTNK